MGQNQEHVALTMEYDMPAAVYRCIPEYRSLGLQLIEAIECMSPTAVGLYAVSSVEDCFEHSAKQDSIMLEDVPYACGGLTQRCRLAAMVLLLG